MFQTQNHWKKAKFLQNRRKFMSSVKGVSHLSWRTKRRMYCKLHLWLFRKRRERRPLLIVRERKRTPRICSDSGSKFSLKPQLQKNNVLTNHIKNREASPVGTPDPLPPLQHDVWETGPAEWSVSGRFSETLCGSSCLRVTDTDLSSVMVGQVSQAALASSQSSETSVQPGEMIDLHQKVMLLPCADSNSCSEQRPQTKAPSQQRSPVPPHQNQSDTKCNEEIISEAAPPDVDLNAVIGDVRDFLDVFFRRYGSFIPLCKRDVLRHLKRRFSSDFSGRKIIILSEVARYRAEILEKPIPSFRVVYKKHIVTLEDLETLADQNWLNDQVMNMYGELIMESSHHKVHFLNSFFHRQLMTKGYDGVKRWTKQVDLFSKSLLLVPVHLEVHWCLVTADITAKKICLYDSQGHNLKKVARNVLKYLMTEAKEKKQMAFEAGWTVSYDEKIPQQTNENDCGVFVLEYSRCLALSRPFQFSQEDIPKIRKRIYKELCDCKLHEPN